MDINRWNLKPQVILYHGDVHDRGNTRTFAHNVRGCSPNLNSVAVRARGVLKLWRRKCEDTNREHKGYAVVTQEHKRLV